MVSIPIRTYSAGESSAAVSFNLLDGKTKSRLKQQYINPTTSEIVAREQMVKGYEFAKDQYVTFTEDELKAMAQEAQKAIEITEFVPASSVDPVYYDKPYYLEPVKKDSKSYALLRSVLEKSGKVGIAKVVLRTREYLAAMLVRRGVLVLNLMRYPAEIRDTKDVEVPEEAKVSPAEVKMAERLVSDMTEKWNPKPFKDEYREDVMKMIEKRIKACIALGGPYDWEGNWDKLPELTREAFRVRSHCATQADAKRHAQSLSLKGVAQNIECPIFVMTGKQDRLIPWQHAQRLASEVKGPCTFLLIEDGNHVANNRAYRWRAQSADWLAEQLNA